MVIAVKKAERTTHVLAADKKLPPGHPNRTEFYARPLGLHERNSMVDMATAPNMAGRVLYEVLRARLVGWKNLRDEDGKDIAFRATEKEEVVFGRACHPPTDETLEEIPPEAYFELANDLVQSNDLTKADVKN